VGARRFDDLLRVAHASSRRGAWNVQETTTHVKKRDED
jgi:hypothetical protein